MVNLNLLPQKVRDAEQLKLAVMLGVGGYALVIMLLGWRLLALHAGKAAVQVELDALVAELNSPALKKTVDEVEVFAKEKSERDAKRSVVDKLRERQVFFLMVLDMLPDLLVGSDVWLTQMDSQDGKEGKRIILEGQAATPEDWAAFYGALETQAGVKRPQIEEPLKPKNAMGRNVSQFKVSFLYERESKP